MKQTCVSDVDLGRECELVLESLGVVWLWNRDVEFELSTTERVHVYMCIMIAGDIGGDGGYLKMQPTVLNSQVDKFAGAPNQMFYSMRYEQFKSGQLYPTTRA